MRKGSTIGFSKILVMWVVASAIAMAEPLSPDEKAAIEAQQANAIVVGQKLQQRITCYADTDKALQSESESLQLRSGMLHQKQNDLNRQVETNKELLNGFQQEYNSVKKEMEIIEQNISALETSVAQKIATINQCRKDAGIFAFVCNAYHELFGVSDQIRKQRNALEAIKRHKETVNNHLGDAQKRYNQASTEYQSVLAQIESNNKTLSDINTQISDIKKTLANMRSQDQAYAKARNAFTDAIANIEGKDLDTERRYYQRKLREASQELTEKTRAINQILEQETQTLTDGRKICN